MVLQTVLATLGVLTLARAGFWLVSLVWSEFLRPGTKLGSRYGKGTWAVVTGASDGLGKCFSKEIAKQGLNVVLVSRTESKLKAVAEEIESKYKVQTKIVVLDMANATRADLESKVGGAVKGLDVSLLINNVGLNVEYPLVFHEFPDDKVDSIVHVNILVTTQLTKVLLPQLRSRKRAGIIFLSSSSGTCPTAMLSVYGASKAYLDNFSQTLAVEYAPEGIDVLSFAPSLLHTPMTNKRKPDMMTPDPVKAVRPALAKLGQQYKTNPYWVHALIDMIATGPFRTQFMQYLLGMHKTIQKKAIRKREKMAKEAAAKSQ